MSITRREVAVDLTRRKFLSFLGAVPVVGPAVLATASKIPWYEPPFVETVHQTFAIGFKVSPELLDDYFKNVFFSRYKELENLNFPDLFTPVDYRAPWREHNSKLRYS